MNRLSRQTPRPPPAKARFAFRTKSPGLVPGLAPRLVTPLRTKTAPHADPSQYPTLIYPLGRFGYALLRALANLGFPCTGIPHREEDANFLKRHYGHPRLFPEVQFAAFGQSVAPLPDRTVIPLRGPVLFDHSASLGTHLSSAKYLLLAGASEATRDIVAKLKAVGLPAETTLLTVSKGLMAGNDGKSRRISRYLREEFPENPIVYLGGASFASGIWTGEPTELLAVSDRYKDAADVARVLSQPNSTIRVQAHRDAAFVELAGILKNPIAIAVGTCHGLGFRIGNSRGALMPQGLREIADIALRVSGADPFSVFTSAVEGDLNMTAYSVESRNHQLGFLFGETWLKYGRAPTPGEVEDLRRLKGVAEGFRTAREIQPILDLLPNTRFPILRGIYQMTHENADPRIMLSRLLSAGRMTLPLRTDRHKTLDL